VFAPRTIKLHSSCEFDLQLQAALSTKPIQSSPAKQTNVATTKAIPEPSTQPIDIVYVFRHSRHGDEEIRFSLRSVAQNLPFIRKVWIFGDRPSFLSDDTSIVEQVPHEYMAPLLGYRTPVRNDFLMLILASLIPRLAFDFVRFADDYIILAPLSRERLTTPSAIEDLAHISSRGSGQWKDQLWRTYDLLKQYGYAGYNFEAHVPQPYTKQLAFEAFMSFRSFLSEERFGGIVTATTVFNFGLKHHGLPFIWLAEEKSKAGFYGKCPAEAEIAAACEGKLFLSFDDAGFGPTMLEFLRRRFPEPCKYEAP